MKKKNLKNLQLSKSTISDLTARTLHGGTVPITIIIQTVSDYVTVGGCSELMDCDSVAACPIGVPKTRFVRDDTKPASACAK